MTNYKKHNDLVVQLQNSVNIAKNTNRNITQTSKATSDGVSTNCLLDVLETLLS